MVEATTVAYFAMAFVILIGISYTGYKLYQIKHESYRPHCGLRDDYINHPTMYSASRQAPGFHVNGLMYEPRYARQQSSYPRNTWVTHGNNYARITN